MPDAPGSQLTKPASFPLRKLLVLLVFAPMLVLGCLIYTYGVDTPYWDEWDEIPGCLVKLHDGTLSWSDLFAQHNEHRLLFPKVILLATAWLTSWNVRAELLVTWLLAGVCSFGLWRLSRATGGTNSNADLAKLASANVLLFTPVEFENWLWGFQVGFLLPVAVMILALWLTAVCRPFLAFFFAIVCSFICTFSIANGFLSFLIVLPLLLFPGGRFQWRDRVPGLVCWLASLVGGVALFLHGYVRPPEDASVFLAVQKPVSAALYLLTYMGSPFGWPFTLLADYTGGALVFILYVATMAYVWKWRADEKLRAQILPWVMLSVYAMVNGVTIMMGRLGFSVGQASGPRYMAFSVMLPISLLFILPQLYLHWRSRAVTATAAWKVRGILIVFLIAALGANLLSAAFTLERWYFWRKGRQISKSLLEFVEVTNVAALMKDGHLTYGDYPGLQEKVRQMSQLGYLKPAPLETEAISALADMQAPPLMDNGHFDNVAPIENGQLLATGWAVLPNTERPADAVLLTSEEKGHPEAAIIFAVTITGGERNDIVAATHINAYKDAGWGTKVSSASLPPGKYLVRAWAFDQEANRAYLLPGGCEVDSGPHAK